MRDMIKPTSVLLIICLTVGLSLAVADFMTKDIITTRAAQDAQNKRMEVMQQAQTFETIEGWQDKTDETTPITNAYYAIDSGRKVGYVFDVSPKGYADKVNITVGITNDGKITSVKIGDHKETPGLGSKVSEPAFIDQFSNINIQNILKVVKKKPSANNEIEAVSGATISSKAVTDGVKAATDLADVLLKEGLGVK